jgi:hypothetical protein
VEKNLIKTVLALCVMHTATHGVENSEQTKPHIFSRETLDWEKSLYFMTNFTPISVYIDKNDDTILEPNKRRALFENSRSRTMKLATVANEMLRKLRSVASIHNTAFPLELTTQEANLLTKDNISRCLLRIEFAKYFEEEKNFVTFIKENLLKQTSSSEQDRYFFQDEVLIFNHIKKFTEKFAILPPDNRTEENLETKDLTPEELFQLELFYLQPGQEKDQYNRLRSHKKLQTKDLTPEELSLLKLFHLELDQEKDQYNRLTSQKKLEEQGDPFSSTQLDLLKTYYAPEQHAHLTQE